MFIVQIADMHIGSSVKSSVEEEQIIKTGIEEIKKYVPRKSDILLFVAGDVIDSSGSTSLIPSDIQKRYNRAKELLDLFHDLEPDYNICYKFCYGNHDITHQKEFFNLVKQFDESVTEKELLSCYKYEVDNISFIFANSCFNDNYEFGGIKFHDLEKCLQSCEINNSKILLFHHTVFSMDENDKAPIRNAAKLLGFIEEYRIKAVFHGHTHVRSAIPVGNNCCELIGSGALFSRGHADVNSQFTITQYEKGIIKNVSNFRFRKDDEKWHKDELISTKLQNQFSGNDFHTVYQELEERVDWKNVLYGVNLHIETSYEQFRKELECSIWNEHVQLGQREYTYGSLAELWEQDSVPEDLYFNHGSYFATDDKSGYEYIVEQLGSNSTSSRAILTTVDMTKIVQSAKCKTAYLPSLMYIQFSFDADRVMHVQMQLRALEIARFLKINICEILFLLKNIKQGLPFPIEKIVIEISAFRVQKKEKFNCFVKAEIDKMDAVDIGIMVGEGDSDAICQLLDEKAHCTETIVNKDGINNLFKGMLSVNKKKAGIIYDEKILVNLKEILEEYGKINVIQQKSSEISSEVLHEDKIAKLIEEVINLLSKKG